MDAVTHHVAHGAGVEIRPYRFRTVGPFGSQESLGDKIERVIPGDRRELSASFRAGAAERMLEAIRVMHPLGVARDFGADHACGVGVVVGAANAADSVVGKDLDLKRAGRRTVVRAGGSGDAWADSLIYQHRTLAR